jgi:hypothetical protein
MYSVFEDRTLRAKHLSKLEKAIHVAEEIVARMSRAERLASVTVKRDDGHLMACATNRRIIGYAVQDALSEAQQFDATTHVLQMEFSKIKWLWDGEAAAEAIGQACLNHQGPLKVTITDSICSYFGVDEIERITAKAFNYAQSLQTDHTSVAMPSTGVELESQV